VRTSRIPMDSDARVGHARGGPCSGDAVDDSQASDLRDYDKCDYSTDYVT
jgi:hypothetical protein